MLSMIYFIIQKSFKMKNMTDKKELIRELTLNNPNLSANSLIDIAKAKGFSIRKTDFLAEVRKTRNLPNPSQTKREKSVPIKYRITKEKPTKEKPTKEKPTKEKPTKEKPTKIPYEETKFGKMAKDVQNKHRISEKNAIRRTRKLLKLPKEDYDKLNEIDYDILTQYGY